MEQIQDEQALEAAFRAPLYFLYKHSPRCGVSAYTERELGVFEAAHPEVPIGWIDVIADRALSRAVSERTGVEHESPQGFFLKHGEVVWHDSHYGIRARFLEAALTGI